MRVLLSIKPEFALKIFDGSKKFEFRKSIFKNKNIKSVVVYASSPMQKVIGDFEIEDILSGDTETLWQQTKEYSGISKCFFDRYFANKEIAHAIKIKSVNRYEKPLSLREDFNIEFAPQSFIYL